MARTKQSIAEAQERGDKDDILPRGPFSYESENETDDDDSHAPTSEAMGKAASSNQRSSSTTKRAKRRVNKKLDDQLSLDLEQSLLVAPTDALSAQTLPTSTVPTALGSTKTSLLANDNLSVSNGSRTTTPWLSRHRDRRDTRPPLTHSQNQPRPSVSPLSDTSPGYHHRDDAEYSNAPSIFPPSSTALLSLTSQPMQPALNHLQTSASSQNAGDLKSEQQEAEIPQTKTTHAAAEQAISKPKVKRRRIEEPFSQSHTSSTMNPSNPPDRTGLSSAKSTGGVAKHPLSKEIVTDSSEDSQDETETETDLVTMPRAQLDALIKRFRDQRDDQVNDTLKQSESVIKTQTSIAERHKQAIKDKDTLTEQNRLLTNRNTQLTTLVSDLQNQLSQLNKQLAQVTQPNSQAETATRKNRTNELTSQNTELTSQVSDLSNQLLQARTQLAQANTRIQQLSKDEEEVITKGARQMAELSELNLRLMRKVDVMTKAS
ncbi:hypothetical protein PMZ80_006862 [Knufia obscura]|uniref:Uncharacterized protein n=1 Tax=Knufia obscura TaxID=1635080 RepID=A0ABR0RJG4_9EURO|nr:hypothetical protein PMZ80_006862 [Knufia obscura]